MSGQEQNSKGSRKRFSGEFKQDAVEIVRTSDKPIAVVARELGLSDTSLGNWVRQDRIDRGEREGLTTGQQVELSELRKDNARLRMERDLLKRAVAFWVKESGE